MVEYNSTVTHRVVSGTTAAESEAQANALVRQLCVRLLVVLEDQIRDRDHHRTDTNEKKNI